MDFEDEEEVLAEDSQVGQPGLEASQHAKSTSLSSNNHVTQEFKHQVFKFSSVY
jgi:hypothetical protein